MSRSVAVGCGSVFIATIDCDINLVPMWKIGCSSVNRAGHSSFAPPLYSSLHENRPFVDKSYNWVIHKIVKGELSS